MSDPVRKVADTAHRPCNVANFDFDSESLVLEKDRDVVALLNFFVSPTKRCRQVYFEFLSEWKARALEVKKELQTKGYEKAFFLPKEKFPEKLEFDEQFMGNVFSCV